MTTSTVPDDVRAYLSAVRTRLDDLPAEEREDLLADVEPSILESAEESEVPVELRLGPPDDFADELRAAAGLPPRAGVGGDSRTGLRGRIATAAEFLSTSPAVRSLAPLWWVVRGFIVVGLVELVLGRSVLSGTESAEYMLAVTLGAVAVVAASVAIGLRRPRRSVAVVLANVVLVIAAVPAAIHAVDAARTPSPGVRVIIPPSVAFAQEGMAYKGGRVENIYAFDRNGRLLQDVRLYDQLGSPLSIGTEHERLRRPVRTRAGHEIFNAFPIRYFEAGTKLVANPAAGAPEGVGRLATKPLRLR
jgi:hypothetical protein